MNLWYLNVSYGFLWYEMITCYGPYCNCMDHVLTMNAPYAPASGRWRWSFTAPTWRICPSALATRASTWSRSLQTCRWQTCWTLEKIRGSMGIRVDHLLTFNAIDAIAQDGQQMQLSLHDPLRVEYVMWKSRRAPNARLEAGTVTTVGGFISIPFWHHPWSSIVHHQYNPHQSTYLHSCRQYHRSCCWASYISSRLSSLLMKASCCGGISCAAKETNDGSEAAVSIFHGSYPLVISHSYWKYPSYSEFSH